MLRAIGAGAGGSTGTADSEVLLAAEGEAGEVFVAGVVVVAAGIYTV